MKAKSMTTFAKDVWKGMSKGVDKGRKFVKDGNKISDKSIKDVSKTKVNNSFGVHVGNFLGGTTRDTIKNYKAGEENVLKAFNQAHKTNDKYDMKKIAGSYVAATSAGRIVSGGGITRDRNGNSNLIGIPFI